MVSSRGPWRWLRWVIGAVVVIAVLAVAGPFVYFHFVEGNSPAPLVLLTPSASVPGTQSASPASSPAGSGPVAGAGRWPPVPGSATGSRRSWRASHIRPSAAALR